MWMKIEAAGITRRERAGGQIVLDFTAVKRIDVETLNALEEAAAEATANSQKIALQGVNVDVYKALKLMKVAPQFSYS